MILAKHSLEATLSPESVWNRWTDVASWPEWDGTLERATIDGPFRVGARLDLRKTGGATFRPVIIQWEDGSGFTLERILLGTRIVTIHGLEPCPMGVRITQRVEARGWASWVVAWISGSRWRASLPGSLRGLARLAANDSQK